MQLLIELGTGFVQGFFAIGGNACLLPLYPGLIAFLANQTPNQRSAGWFGVLVLAGVMTLLLAFGVGVALAKIALHDVLLWVLPLVYLVVIGMGVLLLIGYNPFMRLPMLQSPRFKNPYISAYVYGLLLGPMTLPCAGHYLVTVISLSTTFENAAFGIAYYAFFALGFGVPLLILPLLAQPLQRRLMGWLTTNTRALQRASGVLLIAMGVFGIWTELLVESNPKWELGYDTYGVYWLVAALMALAVGWWSRSPQNLQA